MVRRLFFVGILGILAAAAGSALVRPEHQDGIRGNQFRHPDLDYANQFRPLAELPAGLASTLEDELTGLGVDPHNAFFDLRTGRWGTLILSRPLVPGGGAGNALAWSDLGRSAPGDAAAREQAIWDAFRDYLALTAPALRIDVAELAAPRVTARGERVAQIHVGRLYRGVPVRGAFVKAVVNSGNLVLLGQHDWGDPALDTTPRISRTAAVDALRRHLGDLSIDGFRGDARLEILPVSGLRDTTAVTSPGSGLEHRLVWVLTPTFAGDLGTWEALVDAHEGELLAFQDTNQYATRRVMGGIFPVSNDGVPPDGVEQAGFPMPFADLTLNGEPIGFSDSGGNAPACSQGTLATQLSGRYVRMSDNCGAIAESAAIGDLDLGAGPGTDCDVPAGDHSPGDTHASRTGFYELNRLVEQARGYLPGNPWLDLQLTANMNINDTCNAFWNGSTVNFYRSGGGCANTGEIAAIFDHEWGHGMDDNDTDGAVSTPGESIADIFAQNRLNDSCVGRGFRLTGTCGGYGDPCVTCTGVRDSDWAGRQSGEPHDIDWINSPTDLPGGGCVGLAGTSFGPCLQETHCEGTIVAEAAWDLVQRDLRGFEGSPFDLDLNTALEIGTRLSYLGSANVGDWYQCTPLVGGDGCNADGGYLNFLAVDDDNGDLGDGTPHMSAIFAAFDRHQIACPTPTVQDSGCAGGPTTAPTNLTATPLDKGVHLTWDPVPGAGSYRIYRTEGVKGCAFGKAIVGETTATEFVETGLRNGFEVLYSVAAVGDDDACGGPLAACEAVTPGAGAGLAFGSAPVVWEEVFGDGDTFLDNCELGNLRVEVNNSGSGALTNVRIVAAAVPSHPEVEILTELPAVIAPSLVECGIADAALQVRGAGLAFDDTLELELTVTSDELDPVTVTRTFTLGGLESDFAFHDSKRFTFESDLEGWELVQGTFERTDTGGGADGTAFYVASSALLEDQCDQIRSPLLRLSDTSTLTLFNQFGIEPESDAWFDRADVGFFDPPSGSRAVISPDGGRLYNADGPNGSCVTAGLPGWGGAGPGWMTSTWSASALDAPAHGDDVLRLDVAYGTDPLISGTGFWFDEITLTDVFLQETDAQDDMCAEIAFAATDLLVDEPGNGVLETGETATVAPSWTNAGTLAQTLTGSGDGFTGPGDSTYTIADATADYGTVDPAMEAGCATTGNCYALSISPPSTRPVLHWDTTFDESVSAGTEKSWILHVGESFADAPTSNLFYRFIETMLHHGVTSGCTGSDYCPGDGTARSQMPVFVLRALEGDGFSPPACEDGMEEFFDVPAGNLFCPWIEELARRDVVDGCGGGNYCPGDPVTRAQMAVFALKTFEGGSFTPPPCEAGSEEFDDVPSTNVFCAWIEELARRGVVAGCGGGNYCPAEPVARGQMAVFISKTFGLALYGP